MGHRRDRHERSREDLTSTTAWPSDVPPGESEGHAAPEPARVLSHRASSIAYFSAFFVAMLGAGAVAPYLGLYVAAGTGRGPVLYGYAAAVSAIVAMATNPFAVPLARKIGPTRALATGIGLQACGLVLVVVFSHSTAGTLGAFFVSGLGAGVAFATATAAVVQLAGRERIGWVFSTQALLMNAGAAAAAAGSAALVSAVDARAYPVLALLAAGAYIVFAGTVLLLAARGAGHARQPDVEAESNDPARVSDPYRDRSFRPVLILQFLVVFVGVSQMTGVYPFVWTAGPSITTHQVGILFSINAIAVVTFQYGAYAVARRRSAQWGVTLAIAAFSASAFTSLVASQFAWGLAGYAVAVVLFAIAEVFLATSMQPLVVAASPSNKVVEYTASASLAYGAGAALGPLVGILLAERSPLIYWGTATCVTLAVWVLFARGPLRRSIDRDPAAEVARG